MNFKPYILVGFSQDHINILKKDIGEPALWIGAKKTLKKYYIKYNDIENINLYIPKFEDQFLQEFNIFYKKIKEKFPIFLKCTMRRDITLLRFSPSYYDYENKFFLLCKYYFYQLKSNFIEYVIFDIPPHYGILLVLQFSCNILNIKTILCMQSFFPNHFMILNDLKDIGKFDKNIIANKDLSQFLFPSTQALFYMKKINPIFPVKEFFKLFLRYLTLQKFYMSIKVEKNAYKAFYALRHWKYQKIYNQKTNQFTIPNKYIYFPLNLQPEMTTDILGVHENGEDYANHIHVLQKILSLLPDDMKIIVKENPKQTVYARSKFFFQYIETYKDLIMLVPTTVSSHELIQKSQAIITTSGTSGFEAIQYRKPVICFGLAWYRKLHGVFDGNNLSNIDDILNFRYNEQVLQKDINALFSTFHEGIVDHGYSVLVDNFTIAENLKKVCHALIQHIKAN